MQVLAEMHFPTHCLDYCARGGRFFGVGDLGSEFCLHLIQNSLASLRLGRVLADLSAVSLSTHAPALVRSVAILSVGSKSTDLCSILPESDNQDEGLLFWTTSA